MFVFAVLATNTLNPCVVMQSGDEQQDRFELFDAAKHAATMSAKPPPKKSDMGDMAKWFQVGMDALDLGTKKKPSVEISSEAAASLMKEVGSSDEDSVDSEGEDVDAVLDGLLEGASDLGVDVAPFPVVAGGEVPDAHGPPEAVAPAEVVDDAHEFLWLTRTNRSAMCTACRQPIGKFAYRCVYNPRPPDSRQWKTILWKYYHIGRECLAPLVPKLMEDFKGRAKSTSSSATFLEANGWELFVDIAPLPKSQRETSDMLKASTDEAKNLLLDEFTAAARAPR